MQIDPNFVAMWDWMKSAGPAGTVAAYLIYKDLYRPWKNSKNGNGEKTAKFDPSNFVREGDFAGLSQSLRDFKEEYKKDQERYKQDQSRLEGWIDDLSQRILTIERYGR